MSFNEINGDLKASNPITIMIGLFRFDVMIQILEDFIVCGGKNAIVVAGNEKMLDVIAAWFVAVLSCSNQSKSI